MRTAARVIRQEPGLLAVKESEARVRAPELNHAGGRSRWADTRGWSLCAKIRMLYLYKTRMFDKSLQNKCLDRGPRELHLEFGCAIRCGLPGQAATHR